MDEEEIRKALRDFPGSRRGANGIIFDHPEGSFYAFGYEKVDPELLPQELFLSPFCSKKEIIRLREIKTAHDYLLRLRANAIADSTRLTRATLKRKKLFTEKNRLWSLTEYYNSLNIIPKRYIERLPRKDRRIVRRAPFGFSPLPEANAMCLGSLVGEIVIVSESLRYFYYFMMIAALGGDFGFATADRVDSILVALRIMKGSEANDFDIDPRESIAPHIRARIQGQVDWMVEFTFAHEFAHLLLGHVSSAYNGGGVAKEHKVYYKHDEYSADFNAIMVVRNRKDAAQKLSIAAYRVFLCLYMLELFGKSYEGYPDFSVSKTHPSAIERLWTLREALGDKGQLPATELQAGVLAIQDLHRLTMQRLKAEQRDDLLSFYGSIHLRGLGGRPGVDRIDY